MVKIAEQSVLNLLGYRVEKCAMDRPIQVDLSAYQNPKFNTEWERNYNESIA